jgi:hypothetical protein
MKILKRMFGGAVVIALLLPLHVLEAGNTLESPTIYKNVQDFIEAAVRAAILVALPIVALFIVYAGFKYVFARGNEAKITEAHQNFLWVLIGAILILGAWVFATLIGATLGEFMRGSPLGR